MYSKYTLVLFSFFVFFSQSALAQDENTDQDVIKALILKVKTVEPSQRRVLMNELKIRLRSMHKEARTQVMLELRRSFTQEQGYQVDKRAIEANMHHQNTMSMTESKHMQEHMMKSTMMPDRPSEYKQPTQNVPTQKPQTTQMRGR